MQSLRTLRARPTVILTAARFGTTNSRGRAIVRDPRKVKQKTRASTALEQVPEREKAPVSPPQQPFLRQDPPPSFGSSMAQAFTWGARRTQAIVILSKAFEVVAANTISKASSQSARGSRWRRGWGMGKNTAKKGHGHSKSKERNERARLRKERNRNSYYSDADDREFGAQMEQVGCKIKFIAGDGNCLFRSLADQLEGKPEDHASYRTKVMEHIENNRENFEPYVEDDESFCDYLVRMKGDAEWGGNQELVAASQLFKANIVVHQFKAPRFFIPCEKARLTLHLSYHGEHHYNSVRAIGDEGNGPALPITLQTPKAGSRSAGSRSPWPDQEADVARSCPWASPPNIVHALEATSGRREDAIELLIAARNEPALDGIASAEEKEAAAKPSTPYGKRACDTETNGLSNGGATGKGIDGSENGKGLANGNGKKAVKTPKTRKKVPRSAACPCGSGVKYKNCCKKKDAAVARGQLPAPKPGSAMSSPVDSHITDDLGALVI